MNNIEHIQTVPETPTIAAPDGSKWRTGRVGRAIREVMAATLWFYPLTKVAVFDIDIFLIQKLAPSFEYITYFRPLLFLSVAVLMMLFLRRSQFIMWVLFIVFYPLVWICWRMPILLLRFGSWNLALYVAYSVVGFFKSIKINATLTAIYMICAIAVLFFRNEVLMAGGALALFAVLVATFAFSFHMIAVKQRSFETFAKLFDWWQKEVAREVLGACAGGRSRNERRDDPKWLQSSAYP